MEPQIETLLSEVPEGFVPTFEAKPVDERVVGSLDALDADTRRTVIGVHYFAEQANALFAKGKALSDAHQLEHEQKGFVGGGEACEKNHQALDALQEQIDTLQEKCGTLQAASGPTLFAQLKLERGERLAFRTEGITAAPPEPMPDLPPGLAELLQSLGGRVQVIGPDGITDITPTRPAAPARKRSILDRLRGQ